MKRGRCCKRFAEDISALVDGELEETEKAELMEHLGTCPACRAYYADLCAIHTALSSDNVTAPAGFAERIAAQLPRRARPVNRSWSRPAAMAACCAVAALGVWAYSLLRADAGLQNINGRSADVRSADARSADAQSDNAQSDNAQSNNAQSNNAQSNNAQSNNAQSNNAQNGNVNGDTATLFIEDSADAGITGSTEEAADESTLVEAPEARDTDLPMETLIGEETDAEETEKAEKAEKEANQTALCTTDASEDAVAYMAGSGNSHDSDSSDNSDNSDNSDDADNAPLAVAYTAGSDDLNYSDNSDNSDSSDDADNAPLAVAYTAHPGDSHDSDDSDSSDNADNTDNTLPAAEMDVAESTDTDSVEWIPVEEDGAGEEEENMVWIRCISVSAEDVALWLADRSDLQETSSGIYDLSAEMYVDLLEFLSETGADYTEIETEAKTETEMAEDDTNQGSQVSQVSQVFQLQVG